MIAKEGRIILIPLLLVTFPIGVYAHASGNKLLIFSFSTATIISPSSSLDLSAGLLLSIFVIMIPLSKGISESSKLQKHRAER